MKAIAQNEIIALINDINSFADSSESLINSTQTRYEKDRRLMLSSHSSTLASLDKSYKDNCAAVNNKSNKTIRDAKNILSEINNLDDKLSNTM